MAKRRWSDLTTRQRRAVYLAATVEIIATATALRDLARRPADEVRGSRLAWAAGCLVQPVGPLAYLAFGRQRP